VKGKRRKLRMLKKFLAFLGALACLIGLFYFILMLTR
jgi:hypothetical protein